MIHETFPRRIQRRDFHPEKDQIHNGMNFQQMKSDSMTNCNMETAPAALNRLSSNHKWIIQHKTGVNVIGKK